MTRQDTSPGLSGPVLHKGSPDYVAALETLTFNRRAPAVLPQEIIRARSTRDVQAAVHRARKSGLRISVRGSGHSFSGIARQDGMVLDVSGLTGITIDAASAIVEVGPGVTNAELAPALAARGFAFPLGHCGSVAMSGYLLGGGFGWNSGAWGPACRSVVAAEVVLADGSARWIDETTAPDLFWALRGGGPAFPGVVTRYRLALRPHPAQILTQVRVYPLERIDEVRQWAMGVMAVAPNCVEFTLALHSAPPPATGKVVTAVANVFAPADVKAEDVLEGLALWAPADPIEVTQPMATPYEALYGLIGAFFPPDSRFGVDAVWSDDPVRLARGLARSVASAPSDRSFALEVILPRGAARRGGAHRSCFAMPAETFGCLYGIWSDPADDTANLEWLRSGIDALSGVIAGHYVGEADLARPGRLQGCYSQANWARLCVIRAAMDPHGLFTAAPPRDSTRPVALAAE